MGGKSGKSNVTDEMKVSRRKGFWRISNAEKKNRVRERERYEIAHWI